MKKVTNLQRAQHSRTFRAAVLTIVSFIAAGNAAVSVPNAFSNGMVLQRAMAIPIWGKATSGEQVSVTLSGQTKTVVTPSNGSWRAVLDPMPEGGPYSLTVKGTNTVTITDVYLGEVWQCAGQSNMDTRVSYYGQYAAIQNSTNLPLLRYYTLRQPGQTTKWETCTQASLVGRLSCLGFFFGRELQQKLGTIAVGLIVTAVGGTTLASWLDPATLSANPTIKPTDSTAGSMYDAWVAPVAGYAIRGTVMIQGEQDRSGGLSQYYAKRFPLLVKGWRAAWGQGDFPFYWVQLANYGTVQTSPNEGGSTAVIREGQRLALSLPNTAMTVAIDLGDSLHFGHKLEAGQRLALIPRALIYGENNLVYSGPLFESKIISGNKVKLKFRFAGSGLTGKDGAALKGFAIAGSNNKFQWGEAIISGDTVIVSSASISAPTQVHYGYAGNPIGNLYNKEGLPASPFITEGEQPPTNAKFQVPPANTAIQAPLREFSNDIYADAQGRSLPINTVMESRIHYVISQKKHHVRLKISRSPYHPQKAP
jgi:sialate O-acetylesterase